MDGGGHSGWCLRTAGGAQGGIRRARYDCPSDSRPSLTAQGGVDQRRVQAAADSVLAVGFGASTEAASAAHALPSRRRNCIPPDQKGRRLAQRKEKERKTRNEKATTKPRSIEELLESEDNDGDLCVARRPPRHASPSRVHSPPVGRHTLSWVLGLVVFNLNVTVSVPPQSHSRYQRTRSDAPDVAPSC